MTLYEVVRRQRKVGEKINIPDGSMMIKKRLVRNDGRQVIELVYLEPVGADE